MLAVIQDIMFLNVLHCVAHYDMFQWLTNQAGKRNGSVVDSVMSDALFVDGGYVGVSPVLRHSTLLE